MKKINLGDATLTKADIEDNRNVIIKIRDEALKQARFDLAVPLSHTIAILAHVLEEYDGD